MPRLRSYTFPRMWRDQTRRLMFQYGWDTRCRNRAPAGIVRQSLDAEPDRGVCPLLDAGCGRAGIAPFLPELQVVGVDLQPPLDPPPNLSYARGSVTALPFEDDSFQLVTCIDVFGYLSEDGRRTALKEMLRVARNAVLVACPHAAVAAEYDRAHERALRRRGRAVPDWITEYSTHPYPTRAALTDGLAIREDVQVEVTYCEPLAVCRLVRGAAARSSLLYGAVNLACGALLPVMPEPDERHGYRIVAVARLNGR